MLFFVPFFLDDLTCEAAPRESWVKTKENKENGYNMGPLIRFILGVVKERKEAESILTGV